MSITNPNRRAPMTLVDWIQLGATIECELRDSLAEAQKLLAMSKATNSKSLRIQAIDTIENTEEMLSMYKEVKKEVDKYK